MDEELCRAYVSKCKCGYRFWDEHRSDKACPECGMARQQCKNKPVPGYRYCKFHGGPNPKNDFYGDGVAITTGSQSQFPLTRLASQYIKMQNDGRLLSNRASIDIIRHRIMELSERIDLNQAPNRLGRIIELWDKYKAYRGLPDEVVWRKAIDEEIEKAVHDYESWKQMFEAIDLDRKLVESEVKIIKDIRAVLTAEDAYKLTAELLAAIISTVNSMQISDEARQYAMKRIQYEFTRIVGDTSDKRTGGSIIENGGSEGGSVD